MAEMTPAVGGGVSRQRLDPKSIVAGRLGGWTFTAVATVVVGGGALTALLLAHAPLVSWLATGALALVLLGGLALASHHGPRLRYETTWVGLDADGLEFEHGWLWRHLVSVPRSRIQHTDVTQGPYERRFGLATLVIYTAGTEHASIPIEGLRHESALAFRDALLARGDAAVTPAGAGDAV